VGIAVKTNASIALGNMGKTRMLMRNNEFDE
jgi:hypothetical protein